MVRAMHTLTPPATDLSGEALFARIRPLLAGVQTPAWYIGGEVNEIVKQPATLLGRVALIYPDNYAIGMSHYGLKILYHVVNQQPDLAAERCFTPFPDFADRLRAAGLPLYSLETKTPLARFDVLAFTLQAELTLTNVLETLDLSGIALRSEQRRDDDPVVIVGGAGAWNPQTLAEVIDLVVLGDGEETIVPLVREAAKLRRDGVARREIVIALARQFGCVYAPGLWDEQRHSDGRLAGYLPRVAGLPAKVRGAYVFDLDATEFPTAPIVPHTRVVHDRVSLEVMRGCVHGCRFCQAGMITRPWRIRSPKKLVELARASYLATGVDEIGLLSLSTSDYPYLQQTIALLRKEFAGKEVHLSLPSLRVNEQLRLLPFENGEGRKGGLTLAPEVATDRLRQMISKPIKNEDLYAGVREAFKNGWDHVKLYFMIGVPGEIESDVDGIVEMAENCARIGKEIHGRYAEVHAAVSTFVPKPFVPYQWDGILPLDEIIARQRYLISLKRIKSVRIDCHRPEQSFLEAILARGDRRVGAAVIRAHELGARFDEWGEHFNGERWKQAFADCGIDWAGEATRSWSFDEPLPWDMLDAGPTREYLIEEAKKSRAAISTQNCFGAACNRCGVDTKDCFDLKHAMPLLPHV
ncbi:MAG: TIGR03960 family B12-binding radical SAM protein [Planctomycetes bacterium]|nr:TIGR03960 family B12-binding radical SAM protein [Planctomycetota bacterium]